MLNIDQWEQAGQHVDCVGYYDYILEYYVDSDVLVTSFENLNNLGLDLILETGMFNQNRLTGEEAWSDGMEFWTHFERLGANITGLAMDEPLWHGVYEENQCFLLTYEEAVTEVVDWIWLVGTTQTPINTEDWQIGLIEPYPSLSSSDIIQWIDDLNTECVIRGIEGIDFFQLDPDWEYGWVIQWSEVNLVKEYCTANGIQFSMIYWCVPHPNRNATDMDWYNDVLYQRDAVAASLIEPDEYVIQSWVWVPHVIIPDSVTFSFTNTVRDFFDN